VTATDNHLARRGFHRLPFTPKTSTCRNRVRQPRDQGKTIQRMNSVNIVMNRPAAEARLFVLAAGGDFADGIISYEGDWLGAEEFVSFDSKATSILQSQGARARLLS